MKILHVYQVYIPDDFTGIPRVIWELCEGMAALGIKSEVLCLSDNVSREPVQLGRHLVHYAPRDLKFASTSFSRSVFAKFKLVSRDCDLVHYHYPWPPGDLLYLLCGRNKPSVVTYHSDIIKQKILRKLYAPIGSLFLRSVDKIVATSPNYINSSKILAKFASKTLTIPLGLSDRILPLKGDLTTWRERVGQDFFLFVGALRYYKGLEFLIEAARHTGLPVVIAGRGNIDKFDLPENVNYLGEISDLDKECLLSLCRAFVFPSHIRSEAFGVSLLEAARAGAPMITCEIGTGTTFVNVNEVTGLVVRPKSVDDLSNAMQALYNDDVLARSFGDQALKRFKSKFRINTVVNEYRNLYEKVINK